MQDREDEASYSVRESYANQKFFFDEGRIIESTDNMDMHFNFLSVRRRTSCSGVLNAEGRLIDVKSFHMRKISVNLSAILFFASENTFTFSMDGQSEAMNSRSLRAF